MPLLRNYYVRTVLISWRSAVEPALDRYPQPRQAPDESCHAGRFVSMLVLMAAAQSMLRARRLSVSFGPISRDPVAHSPRNGHRVIAETFVIAADKSGVHGLLDPVRPVLGEQDAEQLAKQRIDLVVRDGQPAT